MENKEIKTTVGELNDDALENVSGGNVGSFEGMPDLGPQRYYLTLEQLKLQYPNMSIEEILKLVLEENSSTNNPENNDILRSIARGQ